MRVGRDVFAGRFLQVRQKTHMLNDFRFTASSFSGRAESTRIQFNCGTWTGNNSSGNEFAACTGFKRIWRSRFAKSVCQRCTTYGLRYWTLRPSTCNLKYKVWLPCWRILKQNKRKARKSVDTIRNNLDGDVTKSCRMNTRFMFECVLC